MPKLVVAAAGSCLHVQFQLRFREERAVKDFSCGNIDSVAAVSRRGIKCQQKS